MIGRMRGLAISQTSVFWHFEKSKIERKYPDVYGYVLQGGGRAMWLLGGTVNGNKTMKQKGARKLLAVPKICAHSRVHRDAHSPCAM